MSDMETHVGRLVKQQGADTAEELCQYIINYHNDVMKQTEYNQTAVEFVRENYDEYLVIDDDVYRVYDNYIDPDNLQVSWKNKDGSIGYAVTYYNGGCGFGEAVEDAVKGNK